MRTIFWIFIVFLVIGKIKNKKSNSSSKIKINYNSRHTAACDCTYEYDENNILKLYPPDIREEKEMDRLLSLYGISTRPYYLCKTYKMPEGTAAFATKYLGKNYIVLDAQYFESIDKINSSYTLGHEIGHHVQNHNQDNSVHQHEQELEADRFAGALLFKAGYSFDQVKTLKNNYEEDVATVDHPKPSLRRKAIRGGWQNANRLSGKYTLESKKEKSNHTPPKTRVMAKSKTRYIDNRQRVENVIQLFINSLGSGDVKTAYSLQDNDNWGTFDQFSSKSAYGGIEHTKILSKIKITFCKENPCKRLQAEVKYLAIDPVNDSDCENGKVYEQRFYLLPYKGKWKIVKAELISDPYCN